MSDLTERLRISCGPAHITDAAADALEAAEAKLAAIDALHRGDYDRSPDSFSSHGVFCSADDEDWPCPTHRILHPEEDA